MKSSKMSLVRFGSAVILSVIAGAAEAQGYGQGYAYDAYDAGYGFADNAVRGVYIGAPLTRTPRPSELVPPAWGYGTYGIPTLTGIRRAPVGIPTVYVIEAPSSVARYRGDRRVDRSAAADMRDEPVRSTAGGARVIAVTVPRW